MIGIDITHYILCTLLLLYLLYYLKSEKLPIKSELPEVLSDFILKYSRRYTPSPDGCRSEETETSNWIDSPYSSTASHTTGSPCNSPASGVSAPNGFDFCLLGKIS